jgi:alkylated DNA repair dioxygenase AlkB
MGKADLGLFGASGREVLIEESLAENRIARCWVERQAMADMELEAWWRWVGEAGNGWRQNDIRVFGQWHKEPRLTAWWGPAYQYANVSWPSRPLDGKVGVLTDRVMQLTGAEYNGVLVNGYRDGQDSMGWHRDNEPEIDKTSIASLSLGATRTFKIRDRRSKQVFDVELSHGDLMVMEHLQDVHEHSVPKRMKVSAPRMNFTFRRLV